jgi:hypothetical protein
MAKLIILPSLNLKKMINRVIPMDFEKIEPDKPGPHPRWRRNHYSCSGGNFSQKDGRPVTGRTGYRGQSAETIGRH